MSNSSLLLYTTTGLYNGYKITTTGSAPHRYPTSSPTALEEIENMTISTPGFSPSGLSEEMTSEMSTSHPDDDKMWTMLDSIWIFAVILLTLEFILALSTNILLINTICYSPSLKTPPNVQLVGIATFFFRSSLIQLAPQKASIIMPLAKIYLSFDQIRQKRLIMKTPDTFQFLDTYFTISHPAYFMISF